MLHCLHSGPAILAVAWCRDKETDALCGAASGVVDREHGRFPQFEAIAGAGDAESARG